MTQCVQAKPFSRRRNRWQDKRLRQLDKLKRMRAAKARLRLARGAAGLLQREPKLARWYPLELGLRDKLSGEVAWVDFKSLRDSMRRLSVLLKFYSPHTSITCKIQ